MVILIGIAHKLRSLHVVSYSNVILNIRPYSLPLAKSVCMSSSSDRGSYDIIIAGGGMVGTTLACKLGNQIELSQKKVLLLESTPRRKFNLQETYSNRVVALNPSTQSLLSSIGAWKHIADARYAAVKKMQVWDASSDAMITFCHDNLVEDIAYIVENDVLLSAVESQVCTAPNVTVVHGAKIKMYKLPTVDSNKTVTVEMEDGSLYTCKLLIGADGATSQVRKAMGVHYLSWSYNQIAVVATLRLTEPTENMVAWQRFLPTGPVALLPLTDDLSSLVWSTSISHAKELLKLSDESFVDALNEALWKQHQPSPSVNACMNLVNKFLETSLQTSSGVRQLPPSIAGIQKGSRASFPLGFGHATRYVSPRVVLIGDSAHRVHPLAGQGVNLGFGDVTCLSELLAQAVYNGEDIGNQSTLWKYESLRQRHNVPTMLTIDWLQRIYGTTLTPWVVLRSVGLQFINALTPLKKMVINHASV